MANKKLNYVLVKTVLDNRGGARHRRAGGLKESNSSAEAPKTFTVRVPISTQQRGTRKLVITPHGETAWTPRARTDDTLIKALARARRWKRMLEGGEFTSITELAKAEGITESYLARILRLNLLSPRIVEAMLDGPSARLPQLQKLLGPFSVLWEHQESWLRLPP